MLTIDKVELFDHVLEQHVNEAAFLWMQRSLAMSQVHHSAASLRKLEARINNHLKGLMVAPQHAWKMAVELADNKESGEVFVLSILALHSGESEKINAALHLGADNQEALKGLISALAWLPNDKVHPLLKPWIGNKNIFLRHLAIAVCSARRLDPQRYLNSLLGDSENTGNTALYCRMLRLIGELKRHDLAPHLNAAHTHDNEDVKFWASRSSLLLGDVSGLDLLEPYVLQENAHQLKAIDIAFRCHSQTPAWSWINQLVKAPQQTAQTIIALSTLGDPHGINWLLARMEEPLHAKVAGHAFSMLTGIDLLQEGLASHRASSLEDEDGDEQIPVVEGYENSPIPQVEKVSQRWQQIQQQFQPGYRYFLGQPITSPALQHTIINGQQGQRLSACMEFALLDKTNLYPNAKANLHYQGEI